MVQDPGEPDEDTPTPRGEGDDPSSAAEGGGVPGVPDPAGGPPGEAAAGARPRARWAGFPPPAWREYVRDHPWRDLSWRDLSWPRPAAWRYRSSRFEPGPLGLLGVMLAAMAVTLLLLQTGAGGLGAGGGGLADEPVTVPGPPDGELRLMLVGDSLTQGSSGDYTWRFHLWSHLREAGVEIDFVGPYDDLYGLDDEEFGDRDYADAGFDTDHAARWGTSTRELATGVAEVAAEHDPQYLLLLAGTEDILAGNGADHALEGVGETVSTVRVVRGETRFVIGELPAVEGTGDDGRFNEEISRFNMGLVDLAQQLTSSDSPVVVARVADGYAPARDNWDEAHPNARGELRIAAAFADALAEPLGVGRAFERPLPHLPVGPLTAPEPLAEESDDGLVLSWEAVPGATGYRVVQRRVEPDPDGATVLPVDVEDDGGRRSVLVESLFSGARYEFVVRPFKGRDEGAESEPLQLVWDDDPPPGPEGIRVRDGGAAVVWDAVEEASHYEVWVRPLNCVSADERRSPVVLADGDGMPGRPDDGGGAAPPDGGAEPSPPAPDPAPTDTPRPEPVPEPAPAVPQPAPSEPDGGCGRRDGRGPEAGEGWRTLGSAGEEPRWTATVSGDYELVVRSYRDYVEGGFSDSVLLAGG
ncbi:GDSL-type esterase/lipase family protein [Nocardiopsis sp. CT-R113]|uniref:GDSL-type esterase/lipase family protein n=1 Tax=Nocardiopsis codii TaxID=3065942 RepID=A0ABU7K912_9ACTN|nr:GDSL-type esterase/lipase family protein [Nocardiopsis sp. CT-R113]MEE2038728.1 GDSL-type esterase/lipase family protein [Nocardiopsis sp. CT-R113]